VTDSGSPAQTASQTFAISMAASTPVTITTTSLPAMTVGVPFSATLVATGGISPYTWSVSSGTLPAGLSLSSAGVISGTPTVEGPYSFSVQVTAP
jgi:hypothetical protein